MTAPSLALTLLPGRYAVAQLPAGSTLPGSSDEVAALVQQKGACATWQQLISQMMRQHGSVLDGVEQMTGQPAPRR